MPDAGEVKAKVVIEYDGGGFADAQDALKALGEEGGAFTRGAGSAVESAFSGLEQQALSTASAFNASTEALMKSSGPFAQWASDTKTFTDAIYGAGAFTDQWGQSVSDLASSVSDASSSFQDFNKNLETAHQFMGGAASGLTDSVTLYNDLAASVEHTSGKMSAFSDIMNTDLAPGIGGFLGEFNRAFMEVGQIAWLAPMIGQAFQGAGSAIYSNAVAAGAPAAGFVQQMNIAAANSAQQGAAFATAFGQGVLPFLSQFNASQQQGGTGGSSWLGSALSHALVGNSNFMQTAMSLIDPLGLSPSSFIQSVPVPGPYIQNNAWVPGAAQLGGNWSAVAGQYPAGSYLQGPPGWVPNPPGLGPQPGPGAGPSTLRVEASHAEIQTGSFTFPQPGGGGSIPLLSGIGDFLGMIGHWFQTPSGTHVNQDQVQGLGITQIPNLSNIGEAIGQQLSNLGSAIHINTSSIGEAIGQQFSNLGSSIHVNASSVGQAIGQQFSNLGSAIHVNASSIGEAIGQQFSNLGSAIHIDASAIGQAIGQQFSNLGSAIHVDASAVGQAIGQQFSNLGSAIHVDASAVGQAIGQQFSDLGSFIHINVSSVVEAIGGAFSNLGSAIHFDLGSLASAVGNAISSALSSIHISIPHFASGVENFGGGYAVVGDAGPELVRLPAGSSVYPMTAGAGVTPIPLGSGGGGPQVINFSVQLDSQSLITALGIPLASTIRLNNGYRGA